MRCWPMQTMTSHAVDTDLLKKAFSDKKSFERFNKDREERLKDKVLESLGL